MSGSSHPAPEKVREGLNLLAQCEGGRFSTERYVFHTQPCKSNGKDRFIVVTDHSAFVLKEPTWAQSTLFNRGSPWVLDWRVVLSNIAQVKAMSTRITLRFVDPIKKADGTPGHKNLSVLCRQTEVVLTKAALEGSMSPAELPSAPNAGGAPSTAALGGAAGGAVKVASMVPLPPLSDSEVVEQVRELKLQALELKRKGDIEGAQRVYQHARSLQSMHAAKAAEPPPVDAAAEKLRQEKKKKESEEAALIAELGTLTSGAVDGLPASSRTLSPEEELRLMEQQAGIAAPSNRGGGFSRGSPADGGRARQLKAQALALRKEGKQEEARAMLRQAKELEQAALVAQAAPGEGMGEGGEDADLLAQLAAIEAEVRGGGGGGGLAPAREQQPAASAEPTESPEALIAQAQEARAEAVDLRRAGMMGEARAALRRAKDLTAQAEALEQNPPEARRPAAGAQ
ncbi:hypothetical protein CYMTET_44522, partial [Cymbomonas tetramitiformis]